MSTETGPQICAEKGPLKHEVALAPAELVRLRSRGGRGGVKERLEDQARFLKRQLSLPVSTMSQW
jgi:hypothetical protein